MYPNFTDCTTLLEPLETWAYQSMDEEQAHNRLPSSSSSGHYEYDEIGRSVSSPSPVSSQLEETEVLVQQQDQHQQRNTGSHPRHSLLPFSVSDRLGVAISNLGSSSAREDVCYFLLILSTFWLFASVTLIIGFYGSFELQLGPNCSYLIEANPIFVHSIEAEQIGVKTSGPMLYGFDKSPTPNVRTSWSQSHTASAAPYDRTGWAYFLNSGSEVEVSYEVKSPRFVAVPLIIAQGSESFHEWIQYPSDPNLVLSWKYIYGSGKISQEVEESNTYYVAVGNLDSDTVMVHLNISIKSVLDNTSEAYFQCPLSNYRCSFKFHHLRPNVAVLTSPGAGQAKGDDGWYIKVSYGPRWLTYLGGSCITTAIILLLFIFINILQQNDGGAAGDQANGGGPRDPLLSPKSNDGLCDGSSYDSISNDEDDLEEKFLEGSMEGKVPKEGETNDNPRRLCVICYDAPRECFFLPCGHCAACFACGTTIGEEAGICPICRRKMNKVRKIFAV